MSNTGLATGTLNCSSLTQAISYAATATLPTSTAIYAIVQIDSVWYKPSTMAAVATQTPTKDSIIAEGDTIAALIATSASPLAGKTAIMKLGFNSDDTATTMPSITLPTVSGKIGQDVFNKVEESGEITIGTTLLAISFTKTALDGGNITMKAKYKQGGIWTDWLDLSLCANVAATAVNLQATFIATNLNVSIAKNLDVSILYQ